MDQGSYGRSARNLFLLAFSLAALVGAFKLEAAQAERMPFQALLNPDGSGRLFTNNGSAPAWMVCSPDRSACRPFATGGDITTTGAPSNVVFWAGENWLTPTWSGNVVSAGPPSLSGTLRANELVTPVPGSWQGGWATDRDETQMSACKDWAGTNCETLTDTRYPGGCPGGAAVLDPIFTGLYLRVADRRVAADNISLLGAVGSPFGQEVWGSSPTTSIAVVGRIASSKGPRTAGCGPPPLVQVSISRKGVAQVNCSLGCRASLRAKGRGGTKKITRPLTPFPLNAASNQPIPRLSLPPSSLSALGPGQISFVVLIDGKPSASRTVRIL
jgi:hypothetical protein